MRAFPFLSKIALLLLSKLKAKMPIHAIETSAPSILLGATQSTTGLELEQSFVQLPTIQRFKT